MILTANEHTLDHILLDAQLGDIVIVPDFATQRAAWSMLEHNGVEHQPRADRQSIEVIASVGADQELSEWVAHRIECSEHI